MDLEGHTMDVRGYRHNNKGFCENFTFPKSINRGRITIVEVPMWRDETARSSISHGLVSKIKPNLPIWGIKRELRGIMVNKGRIHREFRYFRDIFWNLVKLDDELRWEIRENGVFRKITSKRIHWIKNHRIWTWFHGEIEIWSGEKFSDVKIVILS